MIGERQPGNNEIQSEAEEIVTGPVTLGDLMRDDKLLWVYCCDCGHERDVNPASVPLQAKTAVPDVSKHMKCSKCGSNRKARTDEFKPGQSQCRLRLPLAGSAGLGARP